MIPLPPLLFALILSITDGDTIQAKVAIWPHQTVEIAVRLAGIDTPELHGKCSREKKLAQEAKSSLIRLLPLQTLVELRSIKEDKYGGRIVADVRTISGVDVAGYLLKIGLAHTYSGDKKLSWCVRVKN